MGPVNRPLDLEWLEDFLLLVESGNFSRAAQARGVAQPAFSRHIRALEEWAGVELVDRSRHPAAATPAGEVVADAAREVVARLTGARVQAHAAQEQAGRSLRFAATHGLSLAFVPQWLQSIEQQLQLGPIHMVSDSFQACEERMLQRQVQFLLCHGHAAVPTRLAAPAFTFACVGHDGLLPVCAADRKGKPQFRIGGKGTAAVPVLAYSEESGLGRIVRAQLPQLLDAARFPAAITSHHAALLKTMALAGRGVAWLPHSLLRAELADGSLVRSADAGWDVPLEIRLFRAAAPLPPAAEAVWAAALAS